MTDYRRATVVLTERMNARRVAYGVGAFAALVALLIAWPVGLAAAAYLAWRWHRSRPRARALAAMRRESRDRWRRG